MVPMARSDPNFSLATAPRPTPCGDRRRRPRRAGRGSPALRPRRTRCTRNRHQTDSLVNRYYDPTTGEFMTVDPDLAETGQPYQYAGGDPVNESDPSGDLCQPVGSTTVTPTEPSVANCPPPPSNGTLYWFCLFGGLLTCLIVHNIEVNNQPQGAANRGRIQAQGGGVEESVPWAEPNPPTSLDGLQKLQELASKLTKRQLAARALAFAQAAVFIGKVCPESGGCPVGSWSFPRPPLPGGIRVDIEVNAGIAFVPPSTASFNQSQCYQDTTP